MCSAPLVLETHLNGVSLRARGKVRDLYDVDESTLLLVATDRISAFDCILGSGIPCKGLVLTQTSLFWFEFLRSVIPSHLITADVAQYPEPLRNQKDVLAGRSMLVQKATMINVECVARGYLSGSGWKEYQASGAVCGIPLPSGLRECQQLPEPLFTPATKAHSGHDENVSFETVASQIGTDVAERLRALTLQIYSKAAAYARERGLILADTKFEFGFVGDQLVLADEALTPDSSRYWLADQYHPGGPQPSFDKQFVRDFLESVGWDKRPPAPALPDQVIQKTSEKYQEAYLRLTGRQLIA